MKLNLDQVSDRLMTFFGSRVNATARATGFVQRKPRKGLDGLAFLRTLVFGFLEKPTGSLLHLARVCRDQGIEISSQALDQRINAGSVAFLQALFAQAVHHFHTQVALPLAVLQRFTAVNLVDSSVVSLPPALADTYPGAGGCASAASLKVQLVLEFLHGNFTHAAVTPGRVPDQGYTDYLSVAPPGSLTIWDLGYFNLEAIKTLIDRCAYWLSRYLYPTAIFTPDGQRLDLIHYLRTHTAPLHELDIRLGARTQHHLPCRLLLLRVPRAAAERRRREARAKARRQGRTPTATTLFLYGWTLLVTNIPREWVPMSDLWSLYRLRWQVELCFKLFKSYCGLDYITGLRRERILTDIYAKLIAAIVLNYILAPLRIPEATFTGRELSAFQVSMTLNRSARDINRAFHQAQAFPDALNELYIDLQKFGVKQKRKRHPNICHLLAQLCTEVFNADLPSLSTLTAQL